jgi:hypothetical protein
MQRVLTCTYGVRDEHLSPHCPRRPRGPETNQCGGADDPGTEGGTGPIGGRGCFPGLRRPSAPDRSCRPCRFLAVHMWFLTITASFSFLSPGALDCGDSVGRQRSNRLVRHSGESGSSTWPTGIMWPCQRLSPAVGSSGAGLDRIHRKPRPSLDDAFEGSRPLRAASR